ncbi:hypothetical protein V8E55_010354 [Tylopilus felleus]
MTEIKMLITALSGLCDPVVTETCSRPAKPGIISVWSLHKHKNLEKNPVVVEALEAIYWFFCTKAGTIVAVKALRFIFTLEGDSENKSIKILRRELGIWRRLEHGNIVPFLGIAYGFEMEGTMSLVSLWMPDDSLHKFLAKYCTSAPVYYTTVALSYPRLEKTDVTTVHSFTITIVHGDLSCLISATLLWWEISPKHWLISKDPLSDQEPCAGARGAPEQLESAEEEKFN